MSSNRKALVVYNPASGRNKSKLTSDQSVEKLESAGMTCDIIETRLDDQGYISKNIDSETTDLVVIGGDGTLHHVLNEVKDANVTWNLIPSGTGNDFIKNLDIGKNLAQQIETVFHGKAIEVDVGKCNDRLFFNGIGIGFDGQIVSDMLNKKSFLSGHAKYYYFVLSILAGYKPKPLNYTFNDSNYSNPTFLLAIANGTTYGGGFKLAPDAKVSDGLLDICHIGEISPLKRFMNIHRLSNGSHGVLKEVSLDQVEEIFIEENKNILGQIDGEYLGHPPFRISVLPKYLRIRVRDRN